MEPRLGPGTCIFCGKEGRINFVGMNLCGEKHLALYKEKMKIAGKDIAKIKKCATCGKAIKGKGVSLTGSYAKKEGRFKVYKFCNVKCFENNAIPLQSLWASQRP